MTSIWCLHCTIKSECPIHIKTIEAQYKVKIRQKEAMKDGKIN